MKNKMKTDWSNIEKNFKQILLELNIDLEDEHFKKTPYRVAKAYKEIFRGYNEDPNKYITLFDAPKEGFDNQMIIAEDIEAFSMCAHHILPFNMKIHIGYIPDKKIIGLSKFSRISKHFCAKLQTQENITTEIADFLFEKLKPVGLGVVIEDSTHMCASMRGAKDTTMKFTTNQMRGCFLDNKTKNEFLKMIK